MQFNTVLFHTQFREMAFNSLEAITALKAAGLQKVVLTYTIDREDVAFVPYGGYLKEEEVRIRETAETRFEEWRKMLASHGIESRLRIEVGDDNATIIDIAQEEQVDLVVAGRKDIEPAIERPQERPKYPGQEPTQSLSPEADELLHGTPNRTQEQERRERDPAKSLQDRPEITTAPLSGVTGHLLRRRPF
jgi:hypothetical protein